MFFLFSESKWKLVMTLMMLFATASIYLYSTDPGFVGSPEFQQFKASIIEVFGK